MNGITVMAVIPALNEQDTIARVVCAVKPFVDAVIVVDDGSTDATAALAEEQGALIHRHAQNQGYDKSISDGFALALARGAGVIMTFDADGQHDAADIPSVLGPVLRAEADVVAGRRPRYARVTERLFALMARCCTGVHDPLCGLKVYRADVYRAVGYFDRIASIGTQLMFEAARRGYRVMEVPITIEARADHSRFGNKLRANIKIFGAMIRLMTVGIMRQH